MQLGIIIAPLIGLAVGAVVGSIITVLIESSRASNCLKKTMVTLAIISWLAYLCGILYWRFSVVPTLDGTEGSGVGFGAVFIYTGVLIFTLFFTGFATSTIFIQRLRSKLKPNQMPNKTQ